MFLHVCVILFTGGVCLSTCWDTPQQADPPGQGDPLARHPPQQGDPLARRPPGKAPPWQRRPPLCSACWEIRSTSGWYASYWNAILVL